MPLNQVHQKLDTAEKIEQEIRNIYNTLNPAFFRDDLHMTNQNSIYFHGDNPSTNQLSTDGVTMRYNGTNLLVEAFGGTPSIEFKDGMSVFYYDGTNTDYFKCVHDGTDGKFETNAGDVVINPAGYFQIKAEKTSTGDPTGYEGRMYWNTVDNVFKIYADGAWRTIASW